MINQKKLDLWKVKARIRADKILDDWKQRMEEGYGSVYNKEVGLEQNQNPGQGTPVNPETESRSPAPPWSGYQSTGE